jgi:hypothetical protein
VTNISSNSAPLVLIADDLPDVIRSWESELDEYGIGVVKATTIRQLCEVFFAHEFEIEAIILDGCIPGHSPNTIPFVRLVREIGFTKPIIAASSSEVYREMMLNAGCSHEAPKEQAVELLVEVLTAT